MITGTVPEGEYVGVKMYIGVPVRPQPHRHHHRAGAPRPDRDELVVAVGAQVRKIEVVDPAGAAGTWASKAFFVHLGSTGCTGDPASGATVTCTAPTGPASPS